MTWLLLKQGQDFYCSHKGEVRQREESRLNTGWLTKQDHESWEGEGEQERSCLLVKMAALSRDQAGGRKKSPAPGKERFKGGGGARRSHRYRVNLVPSFFESWQRALIIFTRAELSWLNHSSNACYWERIVLVLHKKHPNRANVTWQGPFFL